MFFYNVSIKLKNIFLSLIESVLRNISGGIGQKLRFLYYRSRFKSCGKRVKIDSHVLIYNPENIEIGDDVWIMPFTILHGGKKDKLNENRVSLKNNKHLACKDETLLSIGSQVSIGSHSIIHGYGGLEIEDKVTLSARVSIYSFSHYPYNPSRRSEVTYANSMIKENPIVCIQSPIKISSGVWLGLGVTVYGGIIGKNTFVTTNSIVIDALPENCIASGHPAAKIRDRFELK